MGDGAAGVGTTVERRDRDAEMVPGGGDQLLWAGAWLLALLLAADVLLILGSVLLPDDVDRPLLRLEQDQGYAEMLQYAKLTGIVIMLGLLARRRTPRYLAWVGAFTFFLLTDSLSLHEDGGEVLADSLGLPAILGMRPVDLGELLVSGTAGLTLLVLLVLAYRGADRDFRTASHHLLLLVGLLVGFGVGLDVVHIMLQGMGKLTHLVGALEDGGELIAISLTVAYTFLLVHSRGDAPALQQQLVARVRR